MRILLFVLAIFAVTTGIGTRAQAGEYPWCALLNLGDASYNCGFETREQCMVSVSGIGGFCLPNTLYRGPATPPQGKPNTH
jgi:hypothetical protein